MSNAPTITAIRPTKRDPNRFTIHVDHRAAGTLPHTTIVELGLAVGQAWTPEIEAQTSEAVVFDKCRRAAMNRLNRRMYSRRNLATKLKQLEHDPDVIEKVMDHLEQIGALDDRAFGEAVAREIQRGKPAGPRLIKAKLAQRGLDFDLAERIASEACSDDENQVDRAATLLEKKWASMARFDEQTRKRRLWGLLTRRGFDRDVIEQAFARLPEENEE